MPASGLCLQSNGCTCTNVAKCVPCSHRPSGAPVANLTALVSRLDAKTPRRVPSNCYPHSAYYITEMATMVDKYGREHDVESVRLTPSGLFICLNFFAIALTHIWYSATCSWNESKATPRYVFTCAPIAFVQIVFVQNGFVKSSGRSSVIASGATAFNNFVRFSLKCVCCAFKRLMRLATFISQFQSRLMVEMPFL